VLHNRTCTPNWTSEHLVDVNYIVLMGVVWQMRRASVVMEVECATCWVRWIDVPLGYWGDSPDGRPWPAGIVAPRDVDELPGTRQGQHCGVWALADCMKLQQWS
jgi:hypothetical protein